MSVRPHNVRSRRGLAFGTIAALLLAPLWGGTAASAEELESQPTPQADVAEVREVASGELGWGVRASIRSYLRQGHTNGSVAGYEGAEYVTTDPETGEALPVGESYFSFPAASGEVDVEAQTASIAFDGQVEMRGFDAPWLWFEDARLEIADGRAEIVVDMIESYNVRERTEDLTLAVFDMPADGYTVEGNTLTLSTGAGVFPEVIGTDHLPSYGGPTYVGKNAYTDPFTMVLQLAEAAEETPEDGPYGTSSGAPLSGTSSYMRVEPGYALHADGSTEVRVEGYGFDPATSIYVGIGTMRDPANPEQWRRSAGGSSGPVGIGDYTYGIPQFVAAHTSGDGDIADGVMAADGSWAFTMTVPGSEVPSFFGGTIDCLELTCGFFAFGAHGTVSAANEAYTPVFFDGQNEDEWPDRDTDDPTPIPDPDPDPDPTPVPDPDPAPENPDDDPEDTEKGEPYGESTGTNETGASLTASPAYWLQDSEQTVTLTGEGYPTSRDGSTNGGFYVLFGWIDPEVGDNWRPSKGGSSASDFTYAKDAVPAGTYQRAVNFPGGDFDGASTTMDANGNWTMEFPIAASRFTSAQERKIDCYTMQCGIITIGAAGGINAGGEIFTPVYFTGTAEETGNERPGTTSGTPTANPNAPAADAAQNAAALANTGTESRTLLFGGILLVSLGLFIAAVQWSRGPATRRVRTP